MALIRERDSKRLHIKSKLMGESLVSKSFCRVWRKGSSSKPCPMSMYSRSAGKASRYGRQSMVPVLEEIVQNAREHKIIISTGGGTRSGMYTLLPWNWACRPGYC